ERHLVLRFQQLAPVGAVAERKVLALHDFASEQQVDGIELAPHKPPASVALEVETAADDRRVAVESPPRFHATFLQFIRRHPSGLKRDHPVAVLRIEPPTVVK